MFDESLTPRSKGFFFLGQKFFGNFGGFCGPPPPPHPPAIFEKSQKNSPIQMNRAILSMAPPRGLEPRTWWLHLTRNYFRKRTISLPYLLALGSRCIVSEPSPVASF